MITTVETHAVRELTESPSRRSAFRWNRQAAGQNNTAGHSLELVGAVNGERSGKKYLGRDIANVDAIHEMNYHSVIVCSYLKRAEISVALLRNGVKNER